MTSLGFRSNPLFLRNQLESDGNLDMPIIRSQYVPFSNVEFIGYGKTKPHDSADSNSYAYFFLDDYKFQSIWKPKNEAKKAKAI